ncbi:MAG: penicillin acylase family protein [Bacteroidota bacterium]
MNRYLIFLLALVACKPSSETLLEADKWKEQAQKVTIIRDHYGVPHIYGESDADAIFGLLYAQCEDDFNRVEMNYINAMGRLAEIAGEKEIFRDLRMKLFIDPADMKEKYAESPEWLKKLMDAFADGINYYLHTHPEVKPKLIDRFEPWMALTFSEGSIGGDIERISIRGLSTFYEGTRLQEVAYHSPYFIQDDEPRGSNGFAIAPKNTKNGKSLFLINPHTSFFFRSEVHVNSQEGLSAYGAVTWGQFFVYQGFNDRLGWMHTSTYADAIDEYVETIIEKEGKLYYQHGDLEKELEVKEIIIPYRSDSGTMEKTFTTYRTHHGPIVRTEGDKWISFSIMEKPVEALTQSYSRTKAKDYEAFKATMDLRTNSSNNTVYADAEGNIAYFHGNYIPKRDPTFDWSKPVDGSNPATDYMGLHSVDEIVTLLNPEGGWIQNCNSTPFTAAGIDSPQREDYATYIAPDYENYRGLHAVDVLSGKSDFTIESLIAAAYDPKLTGFTRLLPPLLATAAKDTQVKEAMEMLSAWNYEFGEKSEETTLAVYYGQELLKEARAVTDRPAGSIMDFMESGIQSELRIKALKSAMNILESDFGSWKVPWGAINRYQRVNGEIRQPFNDNEESLPVAFASGRWGSLASFGSRKYPGTKKMYGTGGNSFVAIVEFGDSLKAKSISTGGQSGNPSSPHFDDQALMYTKGEFKDVLFYKADVDAKAKSTYRPGEQMKDQL